VIVEILVGGLRLAHALAAATWIGGTLAYALFPERIGLGREAWQGFRQALRLGIGVFVLTGAVLAAERLSSAALPPTYMALLALKIVLSIWMFAQARQLGATSHGAGWWSRPEARVLGGGVVIYGLAVALKMIYEDTIRVG
jgi:hypothetical protein